MKIRTDFVTNSSSYCTTEVIIDNPVLLKILQKYKDMGLLGDNDSIIDIGGRGAFYFYERQSDCEIDCLNLVLWAYSPKTLDEVLSHITSIMNSAKEYLDGYIYAMLQEELNQREDEINRAYSRVYWKSSQESDGDSLKKFEFDPINGSSYLYKNNSNIHITEIAIENPKLLEILEKYKAKGLFEKKIFGIGEFYCSEPTWSEYIGPECSESPAFYYYEREVVLYGDSLEIARFCPKNLDSVLEGLITIMENGAEYLDKQVFALLKGELMQNKEEIDQSYSLVYWHYLINAENKQMEEFYYDTIDGEFYQEGLD